MPTTAYARQQTQPFRLPAPGAGAGASANLKETIIRLQPQASRLTSCTASVRRSKPGRLVYEYVRRPALPLLLRASAKQAGRLAYQYGRRPAIPLLLRRSLMRQLGASKIRISSR
jgi:hypothetical protein